MYREEHTCNAELECTSNVTGIQQDVTSMTGETSNPNVGHGGLLAGSNIPVITLGAVEDKCKRHGSYSLTGSLF